MIYFYKDFPNFIPYNNFIISFHNYLITNNYNAKIVNSIEEIDDNENNYIITSLLRLTKNDIPQNTKSKLIIFNTESYIIHNYFHMDISKKFLSTTKYNIHKLLDYSYHNTRVIRPVKISSYFPPLYDPILESDFQEYVGYNINVNSQNKSIDVLFYGTSNSRRNYVMKILKKKKLNVVHYCKSCSKQNKNEQYNLINKSKIVLVIHHFLKDRPIDYYRIQSLIANKVFIIHEEVQMKDKMSKEYRLLCQSLVFVKYENFIEKVLYWLNKTVTERNMIVEQTYKTFKNNFGYENYVKKLELKT